MITTTVEGVADHKEVILFADAIIRYLRKYADSLSSLEAASAVRRAIGEVQLMENQIIKGQIEYVKKAWC